MQLERYHRQFFEEDKKLDDFYDFMTEKCAYEVTKDLDELEVVKNFQELQWAYQGVADEYLKGKGFLEYAKRN